MEELDNLQDALTTFRKETDDGDELELHGFEVAALMNLVIADTTVEEACALIPSLSRLPEAAIDEILDLNKSTMLIMMMMMTGDGDEDDVNVCHDGDDAMTSGRSDVWHTAYLPKQDRPWPALEHGRHGNDLLINKDIFV